MNSRENLTLFYVTVASEREAKSLAHQLLEKRLVACANILPAHTSLYEWEGKIIEGSEHVLILKAPQSLGAEIEDCISALHSYDCPCILRIQTQANGSFLQWVKDQTSNQH